MRSGGVDKKCRCGRLMDENLFDHDQAPLQQRNGLSGVGSLRNPQGIIVCGAKRAILVAGANRLFAASDARKPFIHVDIVPSK
jgi:hypothetical protein